MRYNVEKTQRIKQRGELSWKKTMEKNRCIWTKARGFVYPGSEIYGGLANTGLRYLGVELKIM